MTVSEIVRPTLETKEKMALSERDLGVADIPLLVRFDLFAEYERNDDTPTDHRISDPLSAEDFREAINNKNILRGIFAGQDMIAMYWLEPKPENKEIYVPVIMVHPDYRDLGLGTYCLKVADFEASERGFDKCTLTVDPLNGRGVNSYLKNGYQAMDYILDKYGKGIHRLFMQKDLAVGDRQFEDGQKPVRCGDDQGLLAAVKEGFVGVSFIRSGDNRSSQIVFKKYA